MTATLTLTVQASNLPPRVLLSAAGFTGTQIQVFRTDPDGQMRVVRTANPATLVSGAWTDYDYEGWYNRPVTYTVVPLNGSAKVTPAAVTVTVAASWLVHPGIPAFSQPVKLLLGTDDVRTRKAGAVQKDVLGRATPIVVSDGQRKSVGTSLTFYTSTSADEDAMDVLIDDETPLLMQIVGKSLATSVYQWVSLGDSADSRSGQDLEQQTRVWSFPVTFVSSPVGGVAAQRTWADALAEAATWSAVTTRYTTWRGELTGIVGT